MKRAAAKVKTVYAFSSQERTMKTDSVHSMPVHRRRNTIANVKKIFDSICTVQGRYCVRTAVFSQCITVCDYCVSRITKRPLRTTDS